MMWGTPPDSVPQRVLSPRFSSRRFDSLHSNHCRSTGLPSRRGRTPVWFGSFHSNHCRCTGWIAFSKRKASALQFAQNVCFCQSVPCCFRILWWIVEHFVVLANYVLEFLTFHFWLFYDTSETSALRLNMHHILLIVVDRGINASTGILKPFGGSWPYLRVLSFASCLSNRSSDDCLASLAMVEGKVNSQFEAAFAAASCNFFLSTIRSSAEMSKAAIRLFSSKMSFFGRGKIISLHFFLDSQNQISEIFALVYSSESSSALHVACWL